MPVPPSHKTQIYHFKRKSPSSKTYPKRHTKYYNKYKPQHHKNPTKKVIKCCKCGKVGHIAPNCKNQKINALSNKDYYSEISEDDSSSSDNSKNNKSASEKDLTLNDKIENCLWQINMLTSDQEMLIKMIDHIENKDAKTKFARKLMEKGHQNTLSLSNTYKFNDVMSQFEPKTRVTIQVLQFEIKQIKEQIEELKIFTQGINSRIENIEH